MPGPRLTCYNKLDPCHQIYWDHVFRKLGYFMRLDLRHRETQYWSRHEHKYIRYRLNCTYYSNKKHRGNQFASLRTNWFTKELIGV